MLKEFSPFEQLKVKDLYEICKKEIDEDNGEKDVYLNFEDCEKYYPLHYGFTQIYNLKKVVGLLENKENIIALG